jgi:uncharacterized protein (TIGR02391 family)
MMKKSSSKKSRPWEIKDLYNRIASVRAVPILFLEKWERGKGAAGSDRMTTAEINNALFARGVLAKPLARQGAGNLVAGFCQKQRNRGLYPILVEPVDKGLWRFNMSHYETLLREFRDLYPLMGTGTPPTQPRERVVMTKQPATQTQSLENEILHVVREYERMWQDKLQEVENQAKSLSHEISDTELRKRVEPLLESHSRFDTIVREASVVFETRLRTAGGFDSPPVGVHLVDEVFNKEKPALIFSSNPAEQEGVKMLYRGAMQFIRNPPMHKLIEYPENRARLFIRLIDSLLLLLTEAEPRQVK